MNASSRRYSLILADPPWLYRDARSRASAGMARSAYPCMSNAELAALPIGQVAAPQCTLALWATLPKLPDAMALMTAWGFRYCTVAFVWIKARRSWKGNALELPRDVHAGLGHYTRANAELVLLGRRGDALPRLDLTVRQVVVSPVGRHSAKPDEVRTRLVRLFGDVPRIELFARDRVEGWDAWGDEIEGVAA